MSFVKKPLGNSAFEEILSRSYNSTVFVELVPFETRYRAGFFQLLSVFEFEFLNLIPYVSTIIFYITTKFPMTGAQSIFSPFDNSSYYVFLELCSSSYTVASRSIWQGLMPEKILFTPMRTSSIAEHPKIDIFEMASFLWHSNFTRCFEAILSAIPLLQAYLLGFDLMIPCGLGIYEIGYFTASKFPQF